MINRILFDFINISLYVCISDISDISDIYLWNFLTANASNNIATSQTIQNANQGTNFNVERGFAERGFLTNIPKTSGERN